MKDETDLLSALADSLRRLPKVEHLIPKPCPSQADGCFEISYPKRTAELVVEVKQQLYPSSIPTVVDRLKRACNSKQIPLIAAAYLSKGAKARLQELEISHWDLGG